MSTDTLRTTTPAPAATGRAWPAVVSVALGSFNLVTNEFLPVGLLPDVHRDLHVSQGTAGTMVTAPGIVAAASALLLPVALRRIDRRTALLALSLTFVLADLAAAVAPDYPVMLAARALLGIGIGGFWAIAVGLGTRLVPEQHAQRATSLIFSGISIGTIVGVPAGPLLGHAMGWRGAFLAVAALGLIPLLFQALLLPRLPVTDTTTLRSLGTLVKRPKARTVLRTTALAVMAQFAAYTFVTPFLQQHTHADANEVSVLLLVFSAAGIIGNFAAAALLGRALKPVLLTVLAILALPQLLFPSAAGTFAGAAILLAAWGLAYGAVPVALQTWLFSAAPEAAGENGAGTFVATFQSSIALGSLLGALVVNTAGLAAVMYAGALLAVAAVAQTAISARRPQPDRSPR